MSLPDAWVEQIFSKLTLVYGHAFLSRWDGLDINAVKADWGKELAGFQQSPRSINYALANLPERAPTVLEFRALARRAPPEVLPRLDAPSADPKRMEEELAKLRAAANLPRGEDDRRGWARAIVARHRAGDKATPTVLRIAEECLAAADRR